MNDETQNTLIEEFHWSNNLKARIRVFNAKLYSLFHKRKYSEFLGCLVAGTLLKGGGADHAWEVIDTSYRGVDSLLYLRLASQHPRFEVAMGMAISGVKKYEARYILPKCIAFRDLTIYAQPSDQVEFELEKMREGK